MFKKLRNYILITFLIITTINIILLCYLSYITDDSLYHKYSPYTPPDRYFSNAEYRQLRNKFENDALMGNIDKSFAIGTMYAVGLGVKKDRDKAAFWVTCRNNNEDCIPGLAEYYIAMGLLSTPFFYECPEKRDYEEAYWWIKKSDKLGFQDAKEWIEFYKSLGYIDAEGNLVNIPGASNDEYICHIDSPSLEIEDVYELAN